MSFIVKEDLYEKIHECSDMFNDFNDWLIAMQFVYDALEINVDSADVPEAELAYVYPVDSETERTNFTMMCTCCGKIFECKDRAESEFLLDSFRHCFDCGAEFVRSGK